MFIATKNCLGATGLAMAFLVSIFLGGTAWAAGGQQDGPTAPKPQSESNQQPQTPDYGESKKGWFWYQDATPKPAEPEQPILPRRPAKPAVELPKTTPTEKPRNIPPPLVSNPGTMDRVRNMDPRDFNDLMKDYRAKAVGTPTPENVQDYLVMQDIARRKSMAFMSVASMVTQQTPGLSLESDYPMGGPGRAALLKSESAEIAETISGAAGEYALLYFHSETCPYCAAQNDILNIFTRKYPDFQIRPVSILQQPEAGHRFGVSTVPHIFLVNRGSEKPMSMGAGVQTMGTLEGRIRSGVKLMRGEITPEQWEMFEGERGGGFDPLASGVGR